MSATRNRWLPIGSAVVLGLLVASGLRPYDRLTWWLEVMPVLVVLPLLWATAGRWRLTTLLYLCIFVHAGVLLLGGAYTYARVPLGFQLQELLGLQRNPYDRIGHFFQGFVPALLMREILLRTSPLRRGKWLAFLFLLIQEKEPSRSFLMMITNSDGRKKN